MITQLLELTSGIGLLSLFSSFGLAIEYGSIFLPMIEESLNLKTKFILYSIVAVEILGLGTGVYLTGKGVSDFFK